MVEIKTMKVHSYTEAILTTEQRDSIDISVVCVDFGRCHSFVRLQKNPEFRLKLNKIEIEKWNKS